MTDEKKLRLIKQRFGGKLPECLRFALNRYHDGKRSAEDNDVIFTLFYPGRGIYQDAVLIEKMEDFPILKGDEIHFTTQYFLVLRYPTQLVTTTMVLRGRPCPLVKAFNLFAPYHEVEFPISDEPEEEKDDEKTPTD